MKLPAFLMMAALILGISAYLATNRAENPGTEHRVLDGPVAARDPDPLDAEELSSIEVPERIQQAPIASEMEAGAGNGAPDGEARLEIRVVERETGQGIPGVQLWIQALRDGSSERVPSLEGGIPHTDANGQAHVFVPPEATLQIHARKGEIQLSHTVQALSAGESRTEQLEVSMPRDGPFFGRIVDAESRQPIAGAQVRYPSEGSSRRRTISSAENRSCSSDPDGNFELELPWTKDLDAQVDAEGYGRKVFRPDGVHADPTSPLVIELLQGATLRGRVGGVPSDAEVLVSVSARGIDFSMGPGSGGSSSIRRLCELTPDGAWATHDLPPGAGLEVKVLKDAVSVLEVPDRIYLEPGEERFLELSLEAGGVLRGRAVFAATHEPLQSQPIWLVPARYVVGSLESFHESRLEATVTTDESGAFLFEGLAAGEWSVGLSPLRARAKGIAGRAVHVSVSSRAPTPDIELRFHRNLYIEGKVLGPNGKEQAFVRVSGYSEEEPFHAKAVSKEDGTFRLGPLVQARYSLRTTGEPGRAPSDRVFALPGDEEVVLTTKPAGTIRGRLIDPATGKPVAGIVQVSNLDGTGGLSMGTRPDGSFQFMALPHSSYIVSGRSGDRVGMVENVTIDSKAPEKGVEIPLVKGAVLRIVYMGMHPFVQMSIESPATRGPWGIGRYDRGMTSRNVTMPGRITVTLIPQTASGPGDPITRSIDLKAGEEATLEIGDE